MIRLALVGRARPSNTATRLREVAAGLGWEVWPVGERTTITQVGFAPVPAPDVIFSRILGTEDDLSHLLFLQRDLERLGIPVLNKADAVETAVSKVRQAALFRAYGLRHPRTCVITPFADPAQLGLLLGFPVVLKPDLGLGGLGVVRAHDAHELGVLLQEAAMAGQRIMVAQSFLPEAAANLRILVVDGQVVAAAERRAAGGDWRSNVAQGAVMTAVVPDEEEVRLACAATAAVGLDLAGVDVIRTPEGPVVLEVNCSPGLLATEQATRAPIWEVIMAAIARRASSGPTVQGTQTLTMPTLDDLRPLDAV